MKILFLAMLITFMSNSLDMGTQVELVISIIKHYLTIRLAKVSLIGLI
nr:hypothetical protein [uncultured Bacteroides sp.]